MHINSKRAQSIVVFCYQIWVDIILCRHNHLDNSFTVTNELLLHTLAVEKHLIGILRLITLKQQLAFSDLLASHEVWCKINDQLSNPNVYILQFREEICEILRI